MSREARILFFDVEPNKQMFVDAGQPSDILAQGLKGLGLPVITIDVTRQSLPPLNEKTILVVGGSATHSVSEEPQPIWQEPLEEYLKLGINAGIPVLGICYGAQLMAKALRGDVRTDPNGGEFGPIILNETAASAEHELFDGLPRPVNLLTSHNDSIYSVPDAQILAQDSAGRIQVATVGQKNNGVLFQTHLADVPGTFWATVAPIRQKRLEARGLWYSDLPRTIWEKAPEADSNGKKILNNFVKRARSSF